MQDKTLMVRDKNLSRQLLMHEDTPMVRTEKLSRQLVMHKSILMVLRKEVKKLCLLALIEEKPEDECIPRT